MSNPILTKIAPLEKKLTKAGFPAMSPWWIETFTQFFNSSCRQWVGRVGRRGGKSSSLCRIASLIALEGDWKVPPGDTAVIAFISANRDEAAQRLRTISAILDALSVPYTRKKDDIELHVQGRPVVFRTFAASVAGVSGFTAVAVFCDEVSKWRDNDSGSNPAGEVLASVRPTLATQPTGRIFLSSSPFGTLDAHAEAFDLGDSAFQQVAWAPTWVANPTVSEEQTHGFESDVRVHSREYGALAQGSVLSAFDPDAIERAFAPRAAGFTKAKRVMIIDPSSGRKDTWSYAIVGWNLDDAGRYMRHGDGTPRMAPWGTPFENPDWKPTAPYLSFDLVDGQEGAFWQHVSGDEIVDKLAALAKRHGVTHCHGDQREALLLESGFRKRGVTYHSHDWTSASKPVAVETVRRWLADGRIALPSHEKLRKELLAFSEKVTPSGQLSFSGKKDDYVALLVTAAIVEAKGLMPMSPNKKTLPRGVGRWY
jgi:hypothetical protein